MTDTQNPPFPSPSSHLSMKRTRSKLRKLRRNESPDSPVLEKAQPTDLKPLALTKESPFALKKGKKYHTFSKSEVPFPRSYDRLVLDK